MNTGSGSWLTKGLMVEIPGLTLMILSACPGSFTVMCLGWEAWSAT